MQRNNKTGITIKQRIFFTNYFTLLILEFVDDKNNNGGDK